MDIKIIFENDEVLVVDKPAGLVVHSDGKTDEPSLTDWVVKNYPSMVDVGEPAQYNGKKIARPGVVHRLDRETSGVIVLAKTQESFENLKKQFQERTTKKIYNAFVYGAIKEEDGSIDRPIGKSKSDFRRWSAQRGARGELREAITDYKVLEKNKDFSYLEVSPKTGRTHQIRVHLKAINYPVVCDKLYAPKRSCELGFGRLALHARSIAFSLINEEKVEVEADLPEDFQKALETLKNG
ncbi:MAG: RluA family pseudouridine synthase [Parcubacteria group bacterium]|nr:RluA family pseudouridine synthase [Parcubacteria group bacterium]